MKSVFFIIGAIVNSLLVFLVFMGCGGFWGCNSFAETFAFIGWLFNFPISLFVGPLIKSLVAKVFVMGILGTISNGYILGYIFGSRKK